VIVLFYPGRSPRSEGWGWSAPTPKCSNSCPNNVYEKVVSFLADAKWYVSELAGDWGRGVSVYRNTEPISDIFKYRHRHTTRLGYDPNWGYTV